MKYKTKSTIFIIFLIISISNILAYDCTNTCDSNAYIMTDHGIFFNYCDTDIDDCVPADGLNGRLDNLGWCQNEYDTTKYPALWDEGSCSDLFFTSGNPNIGNFGAKYDYFGNQIEIYDDSGAIIEKNKFDKKGVGFASWSSISASENAWTLISSDPTGNILRFKDAKGNMVDNYYDSLDRLIKSIYFNENGQNDFIITNCYDTYCCSNEQCFDPNTGATSSFNLLCEVQDNSGKTKFKYDKKSRVVWQEKTIYDDNQGKRTYILEFEYSNSDNLKKLILPNENEIKYYYNSLNQLNEIKYNNEKIVNIDYTVFGGVDTKNLNPDGNTIQGDFDYNNKQELTGLSYSGGALSTPFQRSMDYDKVGNIKGICYFFGDCDSNYDEAYTYNNLYMLTNAQYDNNLFTYKYKNKLGDRDSITNNLGTTNYNYKQNYPHLLETTLGAESDSFTYDANGNIITTSDIEYKYDSLNRMIKVIKNEEIIGEYTYDHTNMRIKKITSQGTTFYLYQGNNVLYEDFTEDGKCNYVCGDVNMDGIFDINDVSSMISAIFGTEKIALCAANAYNNENDIVNYNDLVKIIEHLSDSADVLECTGKGILSEDPTLGMTINDLRTDMPSLLICNVDGIVGIGGPIDVADITYLVKYLFKGGPAPPSIEAANVDGVTGIGGSVDVADLTYLVKYLFKNGPAPACNSVKTTEGGSEDLRVDHDGKLWTQEDFNVFLQNAMSGTTPEENQTYKICSRGSCVTVEGNGTDECTTNSQCVKVTPINQTPSEITIQQQENISPTQITEKSQTQETETYTKIQEKTPEKIQKVEDVGILKKITRFIANVIKDLGD